MAELDDTIQDDIVVENNNEQQNDTQHDLTLPPDTKTGNDALDKRLDELANASDRNGPKKVEAVDRTKLPNGQATNADGTAVTTQPKPQATVQQQQPSAGIGGWAGKAPRAYGPRFNWDAKGNVIDKTTGNVIAQAGADRKSFERMLPLINNANTEADKFRNMYESATKANTVAASLGLTPEEFSIGGRIMAQWKSDPKKALGFLLKEAQNNGIDVSDLGIAGGGAGLSRTDIEAIVKSIAAETIKPFSFITEEREQAAQHREAMMQADTINNEFMTQYPDAKIHEESLAKIMNAKMEMGLPTSLNEAYLILKNHALENKLDWTKDLVPQLQALQGTAPKNGQPAIQQRQLPNLNGRNGSPAVVRQNGGAMGGDTSSGNIVKEAMRAAGMNVDNV